MSVPRSMITDFSMFSDEPNAIATSDLIPIFANLGSFFFFNFWRGPIYVNLAHGFRGQWHASISFLSLSSDMGKLSIMTVSTTFITFTI